jgi:hypothetical protein
MATGDFHESKAAGQGDGGQRRVWGVSYALRGFDFASLNYVSTGSCLEAMHCGQKWPRAGGVLEHEPTPTSLCMYSVEEHCFHLQFNERHAKDS